MAARRPYRMTPARKAAIRKAQIASARKRKGTGKGKPVSMRRRAAQASAGGIKKRRATAPKTTTRRKTAQASSKKRNLRRIAVTSAAVAAAGGAAYTYKNRERLIIAPAAERFAISAAKKSARAKGQRLTKAQINEVRMQEKKDHGQRSTFRGREYLTARNQYRKVSKSGKNLRPMEHKKVNWVGKALLASTGNMRSARNIGSKNSVHANGSMGLKSQQYWYATYRKDVNARAVQRLTRMQGKRQEFSYKSGKTKMVVGGRVFKMPF